MVSWKGALSAPFVFVALVLIGAGSVIASPSVWFAALGAAGLAIAARPDRAALAPSPLAVLLAAYATWALVNDFLGSPYTAAGVFHPLFLVAGFLLMRTGGDRSREQIFAVLSAGALVLAVWALWQALTGQGRAHAYFETPNTLATLLNLVLAPALFFIANGKAPRWLTGASILLVAGLVTTLSRGGLISLAAAVTGTLFLFGVRPQLSAARRVGAVAACGALIAACALSLPRWTGAPSSTEVQLSDIATTLDGSAGSRVELYRLALSHLVQHPWLGAGYLEFHALVEAHRAELPSYGTENITYFVHNDYLQTLMELGLPGVLGLLAIVGLPFWLAAGSETARDDRMPLFAALSGIAAMAIHALGDFPFYVPACLFVFGVLLGEVDARLSRHAAHALPFSSLLRPARAALLAVLGLTLALPPLAELAAAYGDRRWQSGNTESAAFGFELARRLQPRDWRYHWYAGQFWYAQASAGNPRAATLADRAFAAAVAANPHEPRPLLARLATQIRFTASLKQRQPAATLRRWADQALALAPLNPAVRSGYAAAVEKLSAAR